MSDYKSPEELLRYSVEFAEDPNSGKPNESWVKLIPLGETIQYGDREITFSEGYLKELLSETRKLNAYFDQKANGEAYRQPVWREHRQDTERDGSVEDIKMAEKQGFNGVWVKLSRTDETEEAIKANKIKYVSAGIVPKYKTEDGQEFGPVIREVSLTADPFLKGIGTIQDTLDVKLSTYFAEGGNMPEELQQMLEDMSGKIEEMGQQMQGLLGRIEALEDDSGESEEDGEVEASQEAQESNETPDETSETVEDTAVEASQEAGEEVLTLSAIEEMMDRKLAALTQPQARPKPKTKQGSPEGPALDLSYDDKIKRIMDKRGVSKTEAIEIEFKESMGS